MSRPPNTVLLPLMLVYGAASLLHFFHNAVYLRDYPNLPGWLTSGGVWGAWSIVAGTGVAGYLTILLEAATAVVLLACVARCAVSLAPPEPLPD